MACFPLPAVEVAAARPDLFVAFVRRALHVGGVRVFDPHACEPASSGA
jgi:hypothetical protein